MAGLVLELDAAAAEPGEPITGTVRWTGRMTVFEVALRWETRGKGDKDKLTVATKTVQVADREATEARFELTSPHQPFSFSGELISLVYYVRAEDTDTGHGWFEAEIVIAPGGKEVRLAGA